MSNKIVPQIYRAIIDDVIESIKSEFDAYGVGEDVLSELQTKWENKVVASHVAEFDTPQPTQAPQHHYAPHPMHNMQHPAHQMQAAYATYVPPPPPPSHPQVKAEPMDTRYPLAHPLPYTLPSLPGPQLNGPSRPTSMQVQSSQYNASMANGAARPPYAPTAANLATGSSQAPQAQARIPQTDGPSSSASESPSPPPSYVPRAVHPSLPQPQSTPQAPDVNRPVESEEINSDLDDSDSDGDDEDEEGTLGETDIVFCTYDKVARVKNKWKCVLKDGMIHVNNKDYLFNKCTCEFEW